MDGDGRLIDGDGRWMAMDGDGRHDGHSTLMDSTALDSKGRLDGDTAGMDEEEQRDRDASQDDIVDLQQLIVTPESYFI